MDRKGKGKQIAGNGSSSGGKKRKSNVEFRDEGLRIKKRKNPGVLQFFEESAEVGYYGGSSDEDDDGLGFLNDMEDEPEVAEGSSKDGKGEKGKPSFVFPKEEEINEEEFDRIMEERYKPGSGFFKYVDDDVKDSIEMDALVPTSKDPPIWKVKCAIGREKHSVFCLMHKFVELRKIHTKLQIISVFTVEHVKGFIFIEAEKEHDVLEACKSLTGIYATRMVLLPKSEAPNLLTVKRKTKKISEAKWTRITNGKYKGDLAEVVAVCDTRRKALIKLIPRIDVQALTQKYGGGFTTQKGQSPAPRLISSSELEELRPLIQVRRDRDSGMTFEHIDGMMLKDGYLYKKVSLDSLSSWGVIPSAEEILKFTPVEQKETDDVEWISEIYGEGKEKKILPTGRGGRKGEGSGDGKGESSSSKSENSHELYNLVCFSRKDFGLIVGEDDKGDGYKVLKEGSDGPIVVTVVKKEMQNGPFNSKFTAWDLNNKQISVNDVVKISKGPSEGKQGIVRQVYRGIIFLYDESVEENGGYFCCKSQSCEKVKVDTAEFNEKTGGFDASAFGDSVSSPKSPLSPEKEWQPRERYSNSNQGDKGSMYSIGQKLRIRVGPLKGYLCRVIGLRYSDVTVKLDSQHKIFTVKSEHLAEVRDRNTVLSTSGAAGTGSFQTFDMPGTEGSSGDWVKEAGTSGEGGGNWNVGAPTTDMNSWGSKPTPPDDNTSTWTNAAAEKKLASAGDQPGGWNSWGKTPASEAATVSRWGDAGASKVEASSWGKQGASTSSVADLGSWGNNGGSSDGNKQDEDPVWGKLCEASQKKEESSWGKKVVSESGFGKGDGEPSWGNKDGNSSASNKGGVSWGQQDKGSDGIKGGSAWGNQGGGFGSGEKKDGSSSWNKSADDSNANGKGVTGWGKPDGGSSWGKQDKGGSSSVEPDGGSSWSKQDGGSSWGKKDDGGSSWSKKDDGNKNDGGSSWGKKDVSNKDDGGSSWGKKDASNKDDGGSSWGKKVDGNKDDGGSSWGKNVDGGSSWGKKDDGGSSWGKKDDGGSSWGKKDDGSYSEQTNDRGGRGFGGRRGGGRRGGRDQFGRGRSFCNSEDPAPWSKTGGGSSWGKQDSGEGGSSWGKQNDASGGVSSWGKQDNGGGGSSWGKQGGDAGGGSSWGKKDSGGGGSSWGKQDGDAGGGSSWGKKDNGGGGSSWGKQGGGDAGGSSWGKKYNGGDGSSWGKQDGGDAGGSSWGKKDNGGGGSSWGKQDVDAGGGSSWGKKENSGGGSSWGNQDGGGGSGSAWGKQNDGGSSWSKQGDGGSKPWNEQSDGSRGFGGRRGGGGFRGGFRGGRNQSGRGGRSFDGDQSSGWKRDNQENTWKSDQSGGGSDWKKGWGQDSDNRKPSDSSSGGGAAGNWPGWDTNSKKETNAKPGNESKSAWGTSNDQANTGNNNDGWNKKPDNDVGTSGGADNAWGGKTNAAEKKTGW